MLPPMKHWLVLLFASVLVAKAHDPFEIASVVYIQSNRIEILMEMEFAAGMILSRLEPSRNVSAEDQFESARPRLEQFVGGLFEITAGSNAVLPLRTNVQLGVEAHIRGQLEFALTDYRPLRFSAPGLRAVPDAPYGIWLTVLDMVNKKVLGQTILFADLTPANFPEAVSERNSSGGVSLPATKSDETQFASAVANNPFEGAETNGRQKARMALAVIIFAAGAMVLAVWRRLRARS